MKKIQFIIEAYFGDQFVGFPNKKRSVHPARQPEIQATRYFLATSMKQYKKIGKEPNDWCGTRVLPMYIKQIHDKYSPKNEEVMNKIQFLESIVDKFVEGLFGDFSIGPDKEDRLIAARQIKNYRKPVSSFKAGLLGKGSEPYISPEALSVMRDTTNRYFNPEYFIPGTRTKFRPPRENKK